jgi:acetolactate decarboxylase
MSELNVAMPPYLERALRAEVTRTGGSVSDIVESALRAYLKASSHTLFQVSTSGALVEGVYSGAVSAEVVLQHGDFGLGTFEHLDGEMVVLEGRVYHARGDGTVLEAPSNERAPFAVVTRFSPEIDVTIESADSYENLIQICDEYRSSNNIFYAMRLDGEFRNVRMRAVRPPANGARLIDAAKAQAEYEVSAINGTLIGIWSPGFSSAFSVAGYHFHFLSDDRKHSGHVLNCTSGLLRLRVEALTDFHLALPENESFLKAGLSKNSAGELAYAEQAH